MVQLAVALPEGPVDVVVLIIGTRSMQVHQVPTKETGHDDDAPKRRELARAT